MENKRSKYNTSWKRGNKREKLGVYHVGFKILQNVVAIIQMLTLPGFPDIFRYTKIQENGVL